MYSAHSRSSQNEERRQRKKFGSTRINTCILLLTFNVNFVGGKRKTPSPARALGIKLTKDRLTIEKQFINMQSAYTWGNSVVSNSAGAVRTWGLYSILTKNNKFVEK